MTPAPSDAEIIRKLEESGPAAFSAADLEEIRRRLPISPTLRTAIAAHVRLDECLGAVLGRPSVRGESICAVSLDAAARRRRVGPRAFVAVATLGLVLLLAGLVLVRRGGVEIDPPPPISASPAPSAVSPAALEVAAPELGGVQGETAAVPVVDSPVEAAAAGVGPVESPASPGSLAAAGPWAVALDLERPALSFREGAFAALPSAPAGGRTLREWLEPAGASAGRSVYLEPRGDESPPGFDGVFRLRAPWPPDAVLRLHLADVSRLSLRFVTPGAGLILVHDPRDVSWAAYASSPVDGLAPAARGGLLATDAGRYRSSAAGAFELRVQLGRLVMSRGDVLLFSARLSSAPREVYFEGLSRVRSIGMYRGGAVEIPASRDRPSTAGAERACELPWQIDGAGGGRLAVLDDGGIVLEAVRKSGSARAALCLDPADLPPKAFSMRAARERRPAGVADLVFELGQPAPGSRLRLESAGGKQVCGVGFFDSDGGGAGAVTFGLLAAGERGDRPVPLEGGRSRLLELRAGEGQWLRLLAGPTAVDLFVSDDGESWSWALGAPRDRDAPGAVSTLVLETSGGPPAKVHIRRLAVRDLDAFADLATKEVRARVPAKVLGEGLDLSQWLASAAANKPAGVPPGDWISACAVESLVAGTRAEFSRELVRLLVVESSTRPLPVPARVATLASAALAGGVGPRQRGDEELRQILAAAYASLARDILRRGDTASFPLVRQALVDAGLAPAGSFSRLWWELGIAERAGTSDSTRELRFWESTLDERDIASGESGEALRVVRAVLERGGERTAAGGPQRQRRADGGTRGGAAPREAVVADVSKEAYNVLAEVEAALGGGSAADACAALEAAPAAAARGLVELAADPDLLACLEVALEDLARRDAALRGALGEGRGQLADVRFRQAAASGDPAAVETLLLRFPSTPAASAARVWLGDRALAVGRFTSAAGEYRRALAGAGAETRPAVVGRWHVAAALEGRAVDVDEPRVLEIGGARIEADTFDRLLASVRRTAGPTAAQGGGPPWPARAPLERPRRFRAATVASDVGVASPRSRASERRDDAELAWLVDETAEGRLYLADGADLSAWNLASGGLVWRAPHPARRGRRSGPPRPLTVPGIVCAVRDVGQRRELAARRLASGEVAWTSDAELGDAASDPIAVDGALVEAFVSRDAARARQLVIAAMAPDSGEVRWRGLVARLGPEAPDDLVCRLRLHRERVLVGFAGATGCLDLGGRLCWLRRPVGHVAGDLDAGDSPPGDAALCFAEGLVLLGFPGAGLLEAVDLESGRRRWTSRVPGVDRLLGAARGVVIAETRTGFTGIDAAAGTVLWAADAPDERGPAALAGAEYLVFAAPRDLGGMAERRVSCLQWLGTSDGKLAAIVPLWGIGDRRPYVGPLFAAGGRCLALACESLDARRRLVVLEPAGDAPRSRHATLAAWQAATARPLVEGASVLFPSWALVARAADERCGLKERWEGEDEVFVTLADEGRTNLWLAEDVARGERRRLLVRLAVAGTSSVRLVLRAGEAVLADTTVAAASPARWTDVDVELPPSESAVILQVEFSGQGNGRSHVGWKRLEVAPGS